MHLCLILKIKLCFLDFNQITDTLGLLIDFYNINISLVANPVVVAIAVGNSGG